ncbi:MAG: hypothetical protein WC782_15645 [Methylococcaceae bacterium]
MRTKQTFDTPNNYQKTQAGPDFPSARYFQVHFQYLHEIIGDLKTQVDKANQQIADLQLQIKNQTAPDIPPHTRAGFHELG